MLAYGHGTQRDIGQVKRSTGPPSKDQQQSRHDRHTVPFPSSGDGHLLPAKHSPQHQETQYAKPGGTNDMPRRNALCTDHPKVDPAGYEGPNDQNREEPSRGKLCPTRSHHSSSSRCAQHRSNVASQVSRASVRHSLHTPVGCNSAHHDGFLAVGFCLASCCNRACASLLPMLRKATSVAICSLRGRVISRSQL